MDDPDILMINSPLFEEAKSHLEALKDIMKRVKEQLNFSSESNTKKQQLKDLTKMIKQWETGNLPVPDELRLMQMNLSAELEVVGVLWTD